MKIDFKSEKAPVALAAAMLLLIVICIMTFMSYGEFSKNLGPVMDPTQLKGGRVSNWNAAPTVKIFEDLKNPKPWVRDDQIGHQVFGPKGQIKYNPESGKAEWVDQKNETIDGIPFWWLDQYALSKVEGVGSDDPDKDGFTTYDEYIWFSKVTEGKQETSPVSADSRPDWATKLVGKEYIKEDFYILFKEYNETGGVKTFQVNRSDKAGKVKTEFLKLGEKSLGADGEYSIMAFEKKAEKRINPSTGGNEMVDLSELKVKRDDGLEITLILVDRKQASIISAIIDFPLAQKDEKNSYNVKVGEVFKIRENEYKVIDIQSDKVSVQKQNAEDQRFEIDITKK